MFGDTGWWDQSTDCIWTEVSLLPCVKAQNKSNEDEDQEESPSGRRIHKRIMAVQLMPESAVCLLMVSLGV